MGDKSKYWQVWRIALTKSNSRAGVNSATPGFEELMTTLFSSPAITVYGFYGHAGNAYGSKSLSDATSFLSSEVEAVNTAAGLALDILSKSLKKPAPTESFVLSVGSTPTAHAASAETKALLSTVLNGTLELHAGTTTNILSSYPVLE